jgi:hypothetical protein
MNSLFNRWAVRGVLGIALACGSANLVTAHEGHDHPTTRPTTGPAAHLPADQREAVFDAARDGDIQALTALLDKEPLLVDARPDNDHRTPLIIAAWSNQAGAAELLIERGADIEAEDFVWGASALGWAGWFGSHDVAVVLINAGAEINHPNRDGTTPLGSARGALNYKPAPPGDATPEQRKTLEQLLLDKGAVPKQTRTRPWPIVAGWDDID